MTNTPNPPYTNMQTFDWNAQAIMPPVDMERRSVRGLIRAAEVANYMIELNNDEDFGSVTGLVRSEQDYNVRRQLVKERYENGELDMRLILLLEKEAAFDHGLNFLWGQQLEDLLSGRPDSQMDRLPNSLVQLLNQGNIFVHPEEVDAISQKLAENCDMNILKGVKGSIGYQEGKERLDRKIREQLLGGLASGLGDSGRKRQRLLTWYNNLTRDSSRFYDPKGISFYKLGEAMQEIALVLASVNAVNTQWSDEKYILNTPVVDEFAKSLCLNQGMEYQNLDDARKEVFLLFDEFYTILNGRAMKNSNGHDFSYLTLFGIKHLDYVSGAAWNEKLGSNGILITASSGLDAKMKDEICRDFARSLAVMPDVYSNVNLQIERDSAIVYFNINEAFKISYEGNVAHITAMPGKGVNSLDNKFKMLGKYMQKLESYR